MRCFKTWTELTTLSANNNNNNIRKFIESIPQKVVEQCFSPDEYYFIYSPRQIINTTFTFLSRIFIAHKYECINGSKTKALIYINNIILYIHLKLPNIKIVNNRFLNGQSIVYCCFRYIVVHRRIVSKTRFNVLSWLKKMVRHKCHIKRFRIFYTNAQTAGFEKHCDILKINCCPLEANGS